ncbi:hypothetical protein LSAT2_010802 [Lamellibrachia satsuma]|nr:hypothetical protein LSAT2_010802 [Lamellibrachia satsuma]
MWKGTVYLLHQHYRCGLTQYNLGCSGRQVQGFNLSSLHEAVLSWKLFDQLFRYLQYQASNCISPSITVHRPRAPFKGKRYLKSSDRGGEEERERVFVGDSIVRKTDRVLNKGDDVVVCLPGAKIEAITERVKNIVGSAVAYEPDCVTEGWSGVVVYTMSSLMTLLIVLSLFGALATKEPPTIEEIIRCIDDCHNTYSRCRVCLGLKSRQKNSYCYTMRSLCFADCINVEADYAKYSDKPT